MIVAIVCLSLLLIIAMRAWYIKSRSNEILQERLEQGYKYNKEASVLLEQCEKLKEGNARRIESLEKFIQEKDELYRSLSEINEKNFTYLSILYADHLTLQFDLAEKFYSHSRSRENHNYSVKISTLKAQAKKAVSRYKLMEYKYAYLLSVFPELEQFVDNIDSLRSFDEESNHSLTEVQDDFDRAVYFLSREEYHSLPEDVRNQLALDRYVNGAKSNWQIGRDYEMYVGYRYEKDGYEVEYFGIEERINDLGRDIIAKKNNITKIIQCKYWAQNKFIRENHIAQLYGTSIQYLLSNPDKTRTVIPVLITNTKLSDTAKTFADYLKVAYLESFPLGDYPRIKCNTNRDADGNETRIYHLPFDQLYDRTTIKRKGDIYAFTVADAIQRGFRRAKKYYGVKHP
ncbi:MAG: restriction endonuclease [Prolixibacteraceae bacterium]|jgi:hypothetical protein|nr:restriction endonuclease [Prolixibacteraceae bacterium]